MNLSALSIQKTRLGKADFGNNEYDDLRGWIIALAAEKCMPQAEVIMNGHMKLADNSKYSVSIEITN